MPVPNVRDVIDPRMFLAFQIFGYTLFAFIGVFLCFAARRAILDVRSVIVKWRDTDRVWLLSPKVAMRSESPVPARRDLVKVLSFAPVKTRNRLVVR